MIGQRALIVVAIAAGILAAGIYFVSVQRSAVVVAARDVETIRPLTAEDLTVRSFPSDAIPPGALGDPTAAIGRVPRAPLWRGQLILGDAMADSTAAFRSGLVPPPGTRAIAVPVGPAQALGGAIRPGARVDVIAVPIAGRAPAAQRTELLASSALVIDVRGEHGGAVVERAAKPQAAAPQERLGSLVVAIAPADELRFADRFATSTFVVVLVPDRP